MTVSADVVNKLIVTLGLSNFPGNQTGVFDAVLAKRLEAYWTSIGQPLPTTVDGAAKLLAALQDAHAAYALAPEEAAALAAAYMAVRPSWLKRHWLAVTIGTVVVVGGAVGGYFWWTKSHEEKAPGGLGCPCALGHGGRTAMYKFPSGNKRGHYRDSTGRFHSHP